MQNDQKQHNIRYINGLTLPLRLKSSNHHKYILFYDYLTHKNCYMYFDDEYQLLLFKSCNFTPKTTFLVENPKYRIIRNDKDGSMAFSYARITKYQGKITPAKGNPQFKYYVNMIDEVRQEEGLD